MIAVTRFLPQVSALFVVLIVLSVHSLGSARAEDAAAGLILAQKNCAKCHAVKKGGTTPHKEAPAFTEVVTRYPPSSLAEALVEGISTGHPDMPEFVFSPDEVDDLIAYLETLL